MQLESGNRDVKTNLVRRPIDGYVHTCSGRFIPQPPWIVADLPITQYLYDQWLLEQGRDEAADAGDDWLIHRLSDISAQCMSDDLRLLLSDYLFGLPNPQFEARG